MTPKRHVSFSSTETSSWPRAHWDRRTLALKSPVSLGTCRGAAPAHGISDCRVTPLQAQVPPTYATPRLSRPTRLKQTPSLDNGVTCGAPRKHPRFPSHLLLCYFVTWGEGSTETDVYTPLYREQLSLAGTSCAVGAKLLGCSATGSMGKDSYKMGICKWITDSLCCTLR